MAIAGLDDASSPTGEVTAALSLAGGWKPITAKSFRSHSGSGLSGSPPSEPFNFLNRATRFIISARGQARIFFQDSIAACPSSWRGSYYRRAMTPRLRPYLLVAGTLLPLIVFGVVAARQLVQYEREAVESEAMGRARSAMSAVDAHLRGSIVSLETLAASKSLEAGNIAAFHLEAQRVLRTQPGWVNIGLASADKMQLFNAVYALGKPEPMGAEDASYATALHGARATFGNVAAGTVVQSPTVRVRVPVSYADEVRYVLSAPQNLKHFAELMQAQRLPGDWGISLVDREAHVIARIPAVPAGVEESERFREAILRAPEGWFEGPSREGRLAYTAYATSQLSGWVLGVAMPAGTVEARERRALAMLAGGMLLAFVLGTALAWQIAERAAP